MNPIQRFYGLLKLDRKDIYKIYFYALLNGLVNLSLPLGIQSIINFIQMGEVSYSWVLIILVVLGGIIITGVLQIFQLKIVETIQQRIFTRSAFEFAFRFPLFTHLGVEKYHLPDISNRFFDTITLQKGLPKLLIDFSLSVFMVLFGMLLLSFYSIYFILLAILLLGLTFLIIYVTGKKGLETSNKESYAKYKLAFWLEEIARVRYSFKLNQKQGFHLQKTDSIVSDYLVNRQKHFKVLLLQFKIFVAFKVLIAAGLLILGSILVFNNQMNIGQFVAAEIIIILIINSIEKIIKVIETIYDVLTGLDKIGYVTDLPLDISDGTYVSESEIGPHIEFEDLSVFASESKIPIIQDCSASINPGELTLIKGKTGSGKSLLLHVLAGIKDWDEGQILLDNIPLRNYNAEQYYMNVGVCFPSNQVFQGTLKENITMGKDIKESRLQEVIHGLLMNDYINHLPKGIHTEIDAMGRRLPGGMVQKIELARALVHSPRLVLMEEPLHKIQEDEIQEIADFIMKDTQKATVLIIADHPYWYQQKHQTLNM